MKVGENDYLMSQSFLPSFMKIRQKLWIFYSLFLNVYRFFLLRPKFNAQKKPPGDALLM